MGLTLLAASVALGLFAGPIAEPHWAPTRWGPIVATLIEAPWVEANETMGQVMLRVDLPSVLSARLDEVDAEWMRLRVQPLRLGGQRFPGAVGELADLRVSDQGDGVVDVLLRPRGPLHYAIRPHPDGIVLLIGLRSAALDGAPGQHADAEGPIDAGPPPMTSQAEITGLHAAAASLGESRPGAAFVVLDGLTGASNAPSVRLEALRLQAEALIRAGAPMAAVMPLADALAAGPDRPAQRAIVAALEGIRQQHPGALRFAAAKLLALPPMPGMDGGWLELEQGRLLLQRGDAEAAAERFWRVRAVPGQAPRARFLAATAAALGGDTDAAMRHFVDLQSDAATPDAIREQARLALARLRFAAGRLAEAASDYGSIKGPALKPTVKLEMTWLDIARRVPTNALPSLVPFPFDRDHIDHALLVGVIYMKRCHPRRAEALAQALLDGLADQAPLLAEAYAQIAALGADWDAARPALVARLKAAATELDRGPGARDRRQTEDAQRLLYEAKVLIAAELAALKGQAPPIEPSGFGMQGGQWVDLARGKWVNRCMASDDESDGS